MIDFSMSEKSNSDGMMVISDQDLCFSGMGDRVGPMAVGAKATKPPPQHPFRTRASDDRRHRSLARAALLP